MRKLFSTIIALVLLFQISISFATFQQIEVAPLIQNEIDQYENPVQFISYSNKERLGYITYLIGMNIFINYPDFEVTLDENPYIGLAERDDEMAVVFLYPIPKENEKASLTYAIAFYGFYSKELYYDPDIIVTNINKYGMLKEMCGNKYISIDDSSRAHSMDMIDAFVTENFGEDLIVVFESFLKGSRPIDWIEMWKNVFV